MSNVTWGSYTEPCINCAFAPVIGLPTTATALGVLTPRGCNAVMASFGFAKAGGAIQGNFDKNALGYDLYNDAITLETRFYWDFFDIDDGSGVLSYLSMLAAVGDSKLTLGLINTTQMDLKQHDVLNYKWGFHSLLNAVLWDDSHNPADDFSLHRLNSAPCDGPDGADFEWFEPNVFDTDTYLKYPDPSKTYPNVKFNGLDYMLLFNLYLLKNPSYVKYGRFYTDDVTLTIDLPKVLPYPNRSPYYLTALGTSETGSLGILPEPYEVWSLGKISSNQILEHKNLSGTYQSLDLLTVTPVTITVNTPNNATLSVTYKSTEEIEILDGFVGEEGNEYAFVAIEFKCNATGDGYEMPLAPNGSLLSNQLVDDLSAINEQESSAVLVSNIKPTEKQEIEFFVAPNPNDGSFEVAYYNQQSKSETTELLVVDLFGKEIWKQTSNNSSSNKWKVQLGESDKGLYIIKLVEGGKLMKTDKVVVK